MIVVVVAGVLVTLSVLVVLRPLASGGARPLTGDRGGADEEQRARLLRQLGDLDDDLACGKLGREDHLRLRAPVEHDAARVLQRLDAARAPAGVVDGAGPGPARPPMRPVRHRRTTRRLVTGAAATAAVAIAGVAFLLDGALVPRGSGATITGDALAAARPSTSVQERSGTPAPVHRTPAASSRVTAEQVAAVDAAVARVRRSPKDVAAHLDLARAYTGAASPQLATIEYLAVTKLDPANGEANAALALVAFAAGQARQAEALVDTALAAHPRYPEALYARGLIRLMGLQQPAAAHRDLTAYLAAAPFGAHRATVQTLLAMIPPQESR